MKQFHDVNERVEPPLPPSCPLLDIAGLPRRVLQAPGPADRSLLRRRDDAA